MQKTEQRALSRSQARLLYEVCRLSRSLGRRPTHAEIGREIGLSSNAVWHCFKQLKELGYIKEKPHSNDWCIVKWVDDIPEGYHVPVVGDICNGFPILYHKSDFGKTWLPASEVLTGATAQDYFAFRVKQDRSDGLPFRATNGKLLIFRRNKLPQKGAIVLATLNRHIGLFKLSPSPTTQQLILKKGTGEQSSVPLRSNDYLAVMGILLMPFSESRMQIL